MENWRLEFDKRGSHRVGRWELHGKRKIHAGVDACVGSADSGTPLMQIVAVRESAYASDWIHHQLHELSLKTLCNVVLSRHFVEGVCERVERLRKDLRERL